MTAAVVKVESVRRCPLKAWMVAKVVTTVGRDETRRWVLVEEVVVGEGRPA